VFLNLFYGLREAGVPVAIQEWMMLVKSLELGLHGSSLDGFYNLARATLVKSETYFDAFDRVFAQIYKGVEGSLSVTDELLEWLRDPKNFKDLTEEQRAMLEHLNSDELMKRYLERLAEQDERHDGGSKWIGTGGRSPFGHGGEHPTGIRVGGKGQRRSAMKVAEERHFQNYRTDQGLDLRSTRVALRRLRQLTRQGPETELDLDETIDETCKNAGEIELVFRAERRNNVRLLLLMDVGGTMDPYFKPVSRLLTALHEEKGLRELRSYYFHNCVYESVYSDARLFRRDAVPTGDILRRLDERWKVLFVGDAAMHPNELMGARGNIDPTRETDTPGIEWLKQIRSHFDRCVWLNPEPLRYWDSYQTTRAVRSLFAMHPLTVDGITAAVAALVGSRPIGSIA
jgi:uncharacterized protein with von Willebrand factor type A (vWA) domain